jgi:putative methanogenesis marker protein 8
MLGVALESKLIDCCVIVCEGAGTVIVSDPKLTQGIGARLTGIIKTSPISRVMEKLEEAGATVISSKAKINQAEGVEEAAKLGYKKVAVTIAGLESNTIPKLKDIESRKKVTLYILSIHNSSLRDLQVSHLLLADLVWSCSSSVIRKKVGPKALMQIGASIPVFALTNKGKEIALNYLAKTDLPIFVIKTDLPKLSLENSPYPLT